jgi:hypothetical protein
MMGWYDRGCLLKQVIVGHGICGDCVFISSQNRVLCSELEAAPERLPATNGALARLLSIRQLLALFLSRRTVHGILNPPEMTN